MASQHQCENSGKEQRDCDTDQVHDSNAFVIERERPRLPTLFVVQEVCFRSAERVSDGFT